MKNGSNRDGSNPLAMPELARLLGAPIVLQAHTKLMLTSGALFLVAAWFAWLADSPKDVHLYIVACFSVPVGLVLGYRAKRLKLELELDGAQPLRTAIGVAWRIGVLWIMVSAIGEYLAMETTEATVTGFPGMFILSLFSVGSAFLFAYGATAAAIAIRNRSKATIGWPQVVNLLIGIGGLSVGLFQLTGSRMSALEEKTGAGLQDVENATGTPCPFEIETGSEVSCTLSASDETLPDGTYYRAFDYSAERDEEITISMYADDFDAYLILGIGNVAVGSFEVLAENDDGGLRLGTDSRLNYTFEEDGVYTVIANTWKGGEIGRFRLSIDSESP